MKIEDGGGSAMATLSGDTVRKVLGLDQEQWSSVEGLVMDQGEIFISEVNAIMIF